MLPTIGDKMASGESAKSIYRLLEELGGEEVGSQKVLEDLIKYLDSDMIEDFVSYFRRHHDMIDEFEDDDTDTFDEEAQRATAKFFSSLVPEC